MELRELRYFLALAQEQNFSRAAEFLHTTQPNLSRQIQNIENELDKKLIIRGKRVITLTEDGMLLRKRAQQIVELYDKTENELLVAPKEIKGTISIGGGESYLNLFIADKISKLRETYPQITFDIKSLDTIDAIEELDKGLLDFAIIVEPTDISKYNYVRLPSHDTFGIITRKDSPLALKEYITPSDLNNLPLILSRHIKNEKLIMDWFKKDLNDLNVVANFNLIYNASLLVKSKVGYALGFENLIDTSCDSDLTFRPLNPQLVTYLDIIWKKSDKYPKHIEQFINILNSNEN